MSGGDRYWRRTQRLTLLLLLFWLAVTFGFAWFADDLNAFQFAGFPLGFYMEAQGVLVIYLLIIGFYNWRMRKLDAEYKLDD